MSSGGGGGGGGGGGELLHSKTVYPVGGKLLPNKFQATVSFPHTWLGLFRLQPDFRVQMSQKAIKNSFEMHFEYDFSHFKIQFLTWSHPRSQMQQ